MKWTKLAILALAFGAVFALGACTSESTRADLIVVSINGGHTFFSDLINEADSSHIYIPADEVPIVLTNRQHDSGAPLNSGTPFSEIVVTGYSITFDGGVPGPISGGMNLLVPSGQEVSATVALDNLADKASIPISAVITTTAHLHFNGYLRIAGQNGDQVNTLAHLSVSFANFGDQQTF